MTLKALSHDVRSILSASAQINNYKTAIAELVYNSLDAESTSIAIRVNIQENKLQVIDNGCGIMKDDFKALGKRYMTSKVADITTLKSVPKYYGFRGEFLTNLIEISQSVSIISRYKDGEATWVQTFYENKKKDLLRMTTRPSKGTTVDVKGFLYNLNIQRQAIHPLNDLQKIKAFLEQFSVVHNNISLSLRDDSKNEIIFKIHKQRDIYQTLSTLFDINQRDVQELQIEKNQYKVKAYIGKTEKVVEKHWIYLNGKLLENFSKLHKITNEYLRKHVRLTDIKKSKYRNWEQITVILEKLIKFYVGDINLKEIKRSEPKDILYPGKRNTNEDTRHEIKKIVHKILGSNSKNIRVSQLQNGIKGRLIKRRKRNKNKEVNHRKPLPKLSDVPHLHDDDNAANIKVLEINSKSKEKQDLVRDEGSTGNDKPRTLIPMNKSIPVNLRKRKIERGNPIIENIVKHTKIKKSKKNKENGKSWSQQGQDKRGMHQGDNSFEIGIKNHNVINSKYTTFNHMFYQHNNQKSQYEKIPNRLHQSKLTYESTYSVNIDRESKIRHANNYYDAPVDLNSHSLRCEDINKEDFLEHFTQNYRTSCLSNIHTASTLTYQSHNYNKTNYLKMYDENTQTHIVVNQNKNCSISKAKNTKFITSQSIGNLISSSNEHLPRSYFKNKYHGYFVKQSQLYTNYGKQMIDKSYTIEFTTSNEINNPFNKEQIPKRNQSEFPEHNMNSNNHSIRNSYSPISKPTLNFGNTYTLVACSKSTDYNVTQHEVNSVIPTEIFGTNSVHCSKTGSNNDIIEIDVENNRRQVSQNSYETELISKPKSINEEVIIDEDIQPMNFCETVFHKNESIEKEFACSFYVKSKSNDSLYNNIVNINCSHEHYEKYPAQTISPQNNNENVSHHFNHHVNSMDEISRQSLVSNITNVEEINNRKRQGLPNLNRYNNDYDNDVDLALSGLNDDNFNFKGRLRFLPKGMSQIFEKNGSKAICDYNLDEDYYEDEIYNDFANDIEMQTEIYEPTVQNVEDLSTKDIHRFKIKVHKDNTSLFFDEMSLKEARVLNQVDCKFIAAVMKGRSREFQTLEDYLILFDQHAVHERIRLEKNLTDYFIEDKWKSVPLDNIIIKMSKDEIVYLHNYKDKFNQLGLQWSILDKNELSISSIPEAILGKKPREVEKVMKAIKNLIVEEINVIKLQKGCISSYPKSIMGLIFSEACRFAIKFGDKLSKSDCVELLRELCNCKTPFQCAHGRPVMAVLVDIKTTKHDYNINIESLKSYKLNRKEHAK
ncbi:unnamed protein product [Arctia plantaginis]|uniref:MutL C-terminal dimerisation domain-containing protein n=1 Tax=Arctia plantaginis TaxID=874455 RepID=A0A8S1AU34_ARCPL|nr:unnamed protein product [Arctia plantaginis]